MFSLSFGFIYIMIPGKMPINYYICTGEDPDVDPYTFKKVSFYFSILDTRFNVDFTKFQFPFNAILPAISMVIFLCITIKIMRYKCKINNSSHVIIIINDNNIDESNYDCFQPLHNLASINTIALAVMLQRKLFRIYEHFHINHFNFRY